MGALGLHLTDCEIVLSQIKHQEKQLCLKRRWLMGLPLSRREEKHFEGPKFLKEKTLPESFLREDDLFFEIVKGRVKEAFGGRSTESECTAAPKIFESFDVPKTMRYLHSHLSDLTTRGLYQFALIVTEGSIKVPKTRWSMRKVVKESARKFLHERWNNARNYEMGKLLHQLLTDPQNFRGNKQPFLSLATRSEKAAVMRLLDRLEEFPYQVLVAMSRKLQGKPVKTPSKCGRSRDDLVRKVRRTCMDMLSELGETDVLHQPLAKAMTVAVLSLKLIPGPQSLFLTGFGEISTEMKTLQNDIVKAIWLLNNTEFQSTELNRLRLLFDPYSKISSRYIKPSVKKMLMEYLFDCCEMDAIPKSILEGVAFINRMSRAVRNDGFSKDELEEEIECIMNLSAQTKQIAWDLLPENEYFKDFTDTYLEELQESSDDESNYDDQTEKIPENGKADGSEIELLVEGFGESVVGNPGHSPASDMESILTPPCRGHEVLTPKLEPELCTGVHSVSPCFSGASVLYEDSKFPRGRTSMEMDGIGCMSNCFPPILSTGDTFTASHVRSSANSFERPKVEEDALEDQKQQCSSQLSCQNQYLAVQDACDEMSMVAYDFVGFMLEELAEAEGLELDEGDKFYLKGEHSVKEYQSVARKKKTRSWEDVKGSVIHRAVEKLIPSLQNSAMKKVDEIMSFT